MPVAALLEHLHAGVREVGGEGLAEPPKVVKADDAGFADLDAKYLASCKNPLVKSAIPKKK